jgi:hypothetical protein
MKIICPMCDASSVPCPHGEIVLDCDWCSGRGWIDESENRFYADEDRETESEVQAWPSCRLSNAPTGSLC